MIRAGKQFSARRGLCLNAALLLLFFLVFSAPHRVHHFFEQSSPPSADRVAPTQAHDHSNGSDRDGRNQAPPASKHNDCAVLSVTHLAHGALVSLFSLPISQSAATWREDHRGTVLASYHFSLASPRAPPQL